MVDLVSSLHSLSAKRAVLPCLQDELQPMPLFVTKRSPSCTGLRYLLLCLRTETPVQFCRNRLPLHATKSSCESAHINVYERAASRASGDLQIAMYDHFSGGASICQPRLTGAHLMQAAVQHRASTRTAHWHIAPERCETRLLSGHVCLSQNVRVQWKPEGVKECAMCTNRWAVQDYLDRATCARTSQ